MPSILKLWEEGKLEKGAIIRVPIQKREVTLPHIITGTEDQSITTNNVIHAPDGSLPLTKCMCTSTGVLRNNCQLLLIGEALPIPITLTAYIGAMNGSIAINMAIAALLSIPNQLISARSIDLEQFKKYNRISILGEYESYAYWIDDYFSMCSMIGRQISGGIHYAYDGGLATSGLFEIIGGETIEKEKIAPIRFGEEYTNIIKPVFYVDVRNFTLQMEEKGGAWFIKTE